MSRRSLFAARAVRLAAAALAVGCMVVLPAQAAQAHAYLDSSNPADGASLDKAPANLVLRFSESVEVGSTSIEITDANGAQYDVGPVRLAGGSGSGQADTEEPTTVVAALPRLDRGTYQVSWRTLSTDDLHNTDGIIIFGIRHDVEAAGLQEPPSQAEEATLRWLMFLGMFASTGALVLGLIATRRLPADRRLACAFWKVARVGAALALVVSIALLLWQTRASEGLSAVSPDYLRRWSVRGCGLVLTAMAAAALWRQSHQVDAVPVRRRPVVVAALGVALSAVGSALVSHSASGSFSASRTVADAAHIVCVGVWVGALTAVVFVLFPRLRRGGDDAANARIVLRGLGPVALTSAGLLVATGLYLASGVVGSVDAALLTIYGRLFLAKVVVVAVVIVFGFVNSRRLHPAAYERAAARIGVPSRWLARGGRPERMARTVAAEAVAGMAVLALAAALTSSQPATEPQFVQAPHSATVPIMDQQVDDLQESVSVGPNQTGRNVAVVGVFDTRRPSLGPVTGVDVLVGPTGSESRSQASPLGDGRWSASIDLDEPGITQLTTVVHRFGQPDVSHAFDWPVGVGKTPTRPAVVSTAPIATTLRVAGLVVLFAVLASAAAMYLVRRRRRARSIVVVDVEELSERVELR
jgi:copper transport protein